MKKLHYSEKEKAKILKQKEELGITAEELCAIYKISIATYYNWKNNDEYSKNKENHRTTAEQNPIELKRENKTLRHLYINLSEHNYQLAKFLNKNL